jgi:hypothetical protein
LSVKTAVYFLTTFNFFAKLIWGFDKFCQKQKRIRLNQEFLPL